MPEDDYVLGVDAGGTSTRCWAVTLEGQLIGAAEGGPGNLYSTGLPGFVDRIAAVITQAVGGHMGRAKALCLGAAGVGRSNEVELVQAALAKLNIADELIIENDGLISLAAGAFGDPGVAVISGTGSIAVAMSGDGRRARAGGWGHLLGDEGSGYDISRRALIAVLHGHDGRGPATSLQTPLLGALQLSTPEDLVDVFYRQQIGKERVAALAPLVIAQAENEKDTVAVGIVNDAAPALVNLAVAVHNRLQMPSATPIVVSGGMFKSEYVCRLFMDVLSIRLPQANMIRFPWEAALGAVFLALRRAGVRLTSQQTHIMATQIDAKKG